MVSRSMAALRAQRTALSESRGWATLTPIYCITGVGASTQSKLPVSTAVLPAKSMA